ncbi:MAG: YHS domain-containing protein [Elusimicrobia bacterium]|nr:YHS domain-containing protein [Elusimicrobiota bacterium]
MLMHAKGDGCMGGHGDGHAGSPARAVCPVCGTDLKVDARTPRASHGGKLYYFASEDHLREFIKNPSRFPSQQPDGAPATGHDEHGGQP